MGVKILTKQETIIMSTSESENGHISLTKAGYNEVMRFARNAFNNHQLSLYEISLAVYEKVNQRKTKKERRDQFYCCFYIESLMRNAKCLLSDVAYSRRNLTLDQLHNIESELFRGAGGRLCKLRKSAFGKITNKQSSFSIDVDSGSMSFDLGDRRK